MSKRIAVLAVVSLVAAACSGSTTSLPSADSSETGDTSTEASNSPGVAAETGLEAELRVAAEELVGDVEGGGSFLIHREGETAAVGVGNRNSNGDPITADTEFHVGSISKVFLATIVMQLADEGTVDLDSPIRDYLPDLGINGDPTVRQVLAHQSGFAEYTTESFFSSLAANPTKIYSPDKVLATVADEPAGEPGAGFRYVNTNYIVLGQLIETLTEGTVDEALQARIAEPLGLTHTRFTVADTTYSDNMAAPWTVGIAGEPDFEYAALRSASWAAGSLVSTPSDLQQFLEALTSGELTSESALEQMKPEPEEPYGLGVALADELGIDGRFFIGHGGAIPGYLAFMAIEPETGTVFVMALNNDKVLANPDDFDTFVELL